ncbi:MAG TPA: O-antigen ligase family protein [bacterium]|nr:O-antigen ligase family protein [bacterium]
MRARDPQLTYTRWVAMVTMALYSAGHATIGFPLLLGGALWRLVRCRPPLWHATPLDLPLSLFGVILVISASASAYPSLTLRPVILTIIPAVVVFGSFTWLVYHDPRSRTLLLKVWALGAVPAALVGMVAAAAATDHRAQIPPERIGLGPNGLGTTLFLGSVVALGLAYRARGRERLGWMACGLVALAGLLATESRSSLIGWMAATAYLTWREFRDRPRRMAAALLAATVALAIGLGLAGMVVPAIAARTQHLFGDLTGDRLRIWQISLQIFRGHPWLGTGPGTFLVLFNQLKPPGEEVKWSAHNLWLNYAVEMGALGFLSVLWVILTVFRAAARTGRRLRDPYRPLATAMWIGLLIDQFGDNTLLSISTLMGFWLIIALLVVPLPSGSDDGDGNCQGDRPDDRLVVPSAASPLPDHSPAPAGQSRYR